MSETSTPTSLPASPVSGILRRVSQPLLLFSGALFGLLFLSWIFVLPRFTQFRVADVSLSPSEMAAYVTTLRANLVTQEQKRNLLVLPAHDSFYTALKDRKFSSLNAADLRLQILEASAGIAETKDVLFLGHLSVDDSTKTVTVTGDIRNAGPRSMTVLAAFTERLESLPFVKDLDPPPFTREQNADGTFHSPFTLTFTLASNK